MAIRNRTTKDEPRGYGDAGSASEVSAFKKGLLDIDLQTIRERLAGSTITRRWKRDLVEAELTRRTEGDEDEADDVADPDRKKGSGRTGRYAAAAIIGVCCLIIFYTFYEYLVQ